MGTVRAVWLLALAACYQPSASVGAPCSETLACPSGQVCSGGFCLLPGAEPGDAGPDVADLPSDAAPDAAPMTWSQPTLIPGVNSSSSEGDPSLTSDRLTIVFVRSNDLWIGTRASVTSAFTVSELMALSSPGEDTSPEISADGTRIYFSSDRQSAGNGDIYVSLRIGGTFAPPTRVAELSSSSDEGDLAISPDGLTAIVVRSNTFFRATRATPTSTWGGLTSLGIDLGSGEAAPTLTGNGDLYFHADSTRNLYVARRQGTSFAAPAPIAELNTDAAREAAPFVSTDERLLWFERDGQLYESRK